MRGPHKGKISLKIIRCLPKQMKYEPPVFARSREEKEKRGAQEEINEVRSCLQSRLTERPSDGNGVHNHGSHGEIAHATVAERQSDFEKSSSDQEDVADQF
jgi:hypothetical protein